MFKKQLAVGLAAAFALSLTNAVKADSVVYATASDGGNSIFGTLDLTTGSFTQTATLGFAVQALTVGPNGALLAADMTDEDLQTISPASGLTARFGSVSNELLDGLTSAPGGTGYYGFSLQGSTLIHIASDGDSATTVGSFSQLTNSTTPSNSLAYGDNGDLYFEYVPPNQPPLLNVVNTSNAGLTAVGSGMATSDNDGLTLGFVGQTLYGIDTYAATGRSIYTIDLTTGKDTPTGVTVSGLPGGYTLDTFAGSVVSTPLPNSATAGLGLLGLIGLGAYAKRRRATV